MERKRLAKEPFLCVSLQPFSLRSKICTIYMSYYKLIRMPKDGKAVNGRLYRTSHYFNNRTGETIERLHPVCDTLENSDYLIPALIYKVQVTRSPKFQRLLPALEQVPGRSGIRFHRGSQPEHSKGCILIAPDMEQKLTSMWLAEQNAHDEIRLEICNA